METISIPTKLGYIIKDRVCVFRDLGWSMREGVVDIQDDFFSKWWKANWTFFSSLLGSRSKTYKWDGCHFDLNLQLPCFSALTEAWNPDPGDFIHRLESSNDEYWTAFTIE